MTKYFFIVLLFTILISSCSEDPRVIMVTNMGEIEIQLNADEAPKHTENFIKLVNEGFYTGTVFHRVVPGAIIQGGDPLSKDTNPSNDGTGGPGYEIEAEIKLPHLHGSLAAARRGDQVNPKQESSGSQFYFCLKSLPQLDKGGYTVLAR